MDLVTTEITNNKEKYRIFCEKYDAPIPLFMQPWWWDAVCHDKNAWDVALVFDNENKISGAHLHYTVRLKKLVSATINPILTPYAGIWMCYKDADKLKRYSKYAIHKQIMTNIIRQLPQSAFYLQFLHHSITDWQPFFWSNYGQSTSYTYLLENISDTQAIYQNFKGSLRTDIKKAQKNKIQISTTEKMSEFYDVYKLSFSRQDTTPPHSLAILQRVDDALSSRNQRKIYLAKDENGKIHAGIYIVWDKTTAYYLLGGLDANVQQSGAMHLMLWTAIQECALFVKNFDFLGSMYSDIEYFFRCFGAEQKTVFRIFKRKNSFFEVLSVFFKNYR